MQGIFLAGYRRPKSKKEVKEAVAAGNFVMLEATSIFGNEYDGDIKDAPDGKYSFVGPDPHTKRNFYGTITKSGETIKVS
jgi:hypothetical protein